MAGALDILKGGWEALSGSGRTEGKGLLGGIFGKIMETVGLKKPEVASKALDAKEQAEATRYGLFGEIGKSLFLRQFPALAAATDIGKQLSGNKAAEQVPWQNEFETISALLLLIPGDWRRVFTDFFANSSWFRALVEYWPGLDGVDIPLIGQYLPEALGTGGNIRQRILNNGDPAAVIGALRVMHQDLFVSCKISVQVLAKAIAGDWQGVKDMLLGESALATAAAAALGGGAALAAGADALGLGGSENASPSPSGWPAPVEAVAKAVTAGTGALKGKKLLEMNKQHPEKQATTMQTKLLELLKNLNVIETTVVVEGEWFDNNDDITVGYIFDNGVYFLTYDEDIASADISVRNSQGITIYKETDYWGLNASANASAITAAMRQSPSDPLNKAAPAATPANDNATPAEPTAPDLPKAA
jgi:hypothetical protein